METMRETRRELWRSKWWMPGFSLFLGLLVLAAFWIGGDPWMGLWALLAIMGVVGAVFLFGSRSETLHGLGGRGRDERWAMIDLSATAFAAHVTLALVIALWLVDIARGGDGKPYALIAAVAGVAYIVGAAWGRFRR
jgi:hypothetical protein